jgi:Mrp family chromosome partitioning ATPase
MKKLSNVRAFLVALWRRAGFPVLAMCAGLVGAHAVTQAVPASYEAAASILVIAELAGSADEPGTAGREQQTLALAQTLAPTVTRLVESREVAIIAANSLGVPVDRVAGHLRGTSDPGTQIITARATARSGTDAAAIANAAAEAVRRQLIQLKLAGDVTITTRLLDRAGPPAAPSSPRPALNDTLGALVGLLVGLGLVRLRDRSEDRLRAVPEIAARLGLPILGVLPRLPRRLTRRPARIAHAHGVVADSANATVAALSVLAAPLRHRRLLVTSAHDQDGKPLVAALLALGLAEQHQRVTLVEAQLRQPVLAELFPESTRCTVQQVLAGVRTAEPLAGSARLTVLPAEPPGPDGPLSIEREALGNLLDRRAEQGDLVLVHAPPVLAGAELAGLAAHADGVLLVVQVGVTRIAQAGQAALLLRRLGLPLAGVVAIAPPGEAAGWQQGATGPVSGRGWQVERESQLTVPSQWTSS